MRVMRLKLSRGNSLLEVMIAVVLTAVTALGLIASQLWIARESRAAALREHAVLVADAIAEAARVPANGDVILRQWNERAASLLPKGETSTSGQGSGVSFARVTWSAVATLPAPSEIIDKPETCGDLAVSAGLACVALAFVR